MCPSQPTPIVVMDGPSVGPAPWCLRWIQSRWCQGLGEALPFLHAMPTFASTTVDSTSVTVLILRCLVVVWRGEIPATSVVGGVPPMVLVWGLCVFWCWRHLVGWGR